MKPIIFRFLIRMLITLVSLTRSLFSENMIISIRWFHVPLDLNILDRSFLDATLPIVSLGAIFARKLKRKVYERKMEFYLKLKRTWVTVEK